MSRLWRDLSVAKKLYAVVGLMAMLIAAELLTLIFAMNILSSVRAFVVGEGLWSKSQKDAVQSIYQYALTGDPENYRLFQNHLMIPKGDRKARLALQQEPADHAAAREGFIKGGNHPDDVEGMIDLLQRFHWISFIETAVGAWTRADVLMDQLIDVSGEIDRIIRTQGADRQQLTVWLQRLAVVNENLTREENLFSHSLGEGSRWLENLLFVLLTLTVLTVEGTGLYLTFRFSNSLGASLKELSEVARQVGRGNFTLRAPVRSNDELGQLAQSVNKMSEDLKANVGGRLQAENASEIKSIFVANTSHEMRSPLGIILGFVEILKDPNLPPAERAKFLDIIEQTGRNLNRIIDDILDISKIESGHLEIELVRVDVEEFIQGLEMLFRVRVQQRGNSVKFVREASAPKFITTDRGRLQQILVNLIGNANKFTEKGEIRIEYGGLKHKLYFRISDTGIGLETVQAARLFQAFSQADQSTSRRYGGTGLGLVLSKRIAIILGGDVVLESSEPGVGSTFLVTVDDQTESFARDHMVVPFKSPRRSGNGASPAIFKDRKVLVVDDSEDNHLLLEALLGRMGLNVTSAMDGQEAIDKAARETFDLVIMDIQMPVMDGYVTTQSLRARNYRGPIVALTANAMTETRDRCLKAGCDDYLTKPVEIEILRSTLELHIH